MIEKIVAIDMNLEKEEARFHFKSECCTDMPFNVLQELLDKLSGDYEYENFADSCVASVEYSPYKCSVTNREGYLEELTLVRL